jgi:CheY-like chemotaxis protein
MPGGVSGLQLVATARRRWPDLPILMTSGYTAPDTSGGPADVPTGVPLLSKPYRRATLAQELRGLLDAAPEPPTAPAPPPPPPANANQADAEPGGSGPADGLRVLLVEDESLIRMACSDALIELGHFVEEAGDGPEALAALDAGRRFDVLMTDVGLPGMRGTELARLARERYPGIWVVYVTGQAPGGGLDAEPRTLVLSKPYRREDLEQTLRRVPRT